MARAFLAAVLPISAASRPEISPMAPSVLDGVGGDEIGELGRLGAANFDLAHVADIEDAHRMAHGVVLFDDSGVLDGHVPPAEIHHPGAEPAMDGVQRRGTESGRGWHANSG